MACYSTSRSARSQSSRYLPLRFALIDSMVSAVSYPLLDLVPRLGSSYWISSVSNLKKYRGILGSASGLLLSGLACPVGRSTSAPLSARAFYCGRPACLQRTKCGERVPHSSRLQASQDPFFLSSRRGLLATCILRGKQSYGLTVERRDVAGWAMLKKGIICQKSEESRLPPAEQARRYSMSP